MFYRNTYIILLKRYGIMNCTKCPYNANIWVYSKEEPSIYKFHRIYKYIVDKEKQVVYSSFHDRFINEALTFVD